MSLYEDLELLRSLDTDLKVLCDELGFTLPAAFRARARTLDKLLMKLDELAIPWPASWVDIKSRLAGDPTLLVTIAASIAAWESRAASEEAFPPEVSRALHRLVVEHLFRMTIRNAARWAQRVAARRARTPNRGDFWGFLFVNLLNVRRGRITPASLVTRLAEKTTHRANQARQMDVSHEGGASKRKPLPKMRSDAQSGCTIGCTAHNRNS